MTYEEIEELTDLIFGNCYDTLKTINELNKKVNELSNKLDDYKTIIRKAQDFIMDNIYYDEYCYTEVLAGDDITKLNNILANVKSKGE